MTWIKPITLKTYSCTLVPLSMDHKQDLIEAVKDGNLWEIKAALVPTPDKMEQEIQRRIELENMIPFAVIDNKTGKVIGMTSYSRIDGQNKHLDIGYTWYAKSHQKTSINTECKLILLKHAFEELNCIAVRFRVDALNWTSRRAVERIGAKLDGIIRNYSIHSDGTINDMCFYSIIKSEWQNIKRNLNILLKRPR